MGKNSPNKRKSQNNVVTTPKKQKLNEENKTTPGSNTKITPKGGKQNNTPKGGKQNNTPKGGKQNNTPKGGKQKNTPKTKLQKKSDEEDEFDLNSSGGESGSYVVEQEVKPEKITKTMNEDNLDSDEAEASDSDEAEASDTDDSEDDETEEIDNAVNENSENDEKKQTVNNKTKTKGKQNAKKSKAEITEDIKKFVDGDEDLKKKKRYVLFLGNLSFDATDEDIKEHFKKGINIISVRIPKKAGKQSRGFGYLEVKDQESYLKGMAMHHTFLKGRRLNVQYTAGGSGNSVTKNRKIKSKNLKLNALRRDGKLDGSMKHSNKRSVRRAKKRAFEKAAE